MKGLFQEVKKEAAQASTFKFAFKLGFDDDELEEPIAVSGVKKNKNKKKKKKKTNNTNATSSTFGQDDDDIEDEGEEAAAIDKADATAPLTSDSVVTSIESVEQHICKLSLSDVGDTNANVPDPVETAAISTTDSVVAAAAVQPVLSKSQKKNMKKKKAKKAGGGDEADDNQLEAEPLEAPSNVNAPTKKASADSAAPAVPNSKVATNAAKSVTKKDDAQARKEALLKAQQIRAMLDLHEQKQSPASSEHNRPNSVSASSSGSRGGPHFLSSKDPELDEASRLRCRYGMGRNLVAIGPAKVRDPNWLPPPPGLTKKVAPSAAGTAAHAAPVSPFKKSIGKASSSIASNADSSAVIANVEGQSHSSPFSFSFNGL